MAARSAPGHRQRRAPDPGAPTTRASGSPLAAPVPRPPRAPARRKDVGAAYVLPDRVARRTVCGALVLGYRAGDSRNDEEQTQAREFAARIAVAVVVRLARRAALRAGPLRLANGRCPTGCCCQDRLVAGDRALPARATAASPCSSSTSTASRSVNDTFGPLRGRRGAARDGARLALRARAATPSRGWAATSSRSSFPHPSARRRPDRVREASWRARAAVRRRRPADLPRREHRHRLYPEDGETAEELLKNADTAMYRAKASGRVAGGLLRGADERRGRSACVLDRDLRLAIERGELELHYQPQYDLRTGRIRSAPRRCCAGGTRARPGSPARFIPLAEESGFIEQHRQLGAARRLPRSGGVAGRGVAPGAGCPSNVSPRQFRKAGLAQHVRGRQRRGIDIAPASSWRSPRGSLAGPSGRWSRACWASSTP